MLSKNHALQALRLVLFGLYLTMKGLSYTSPTRKNFNFINAYEMTCAFRYQGDMRKTTTKTLLIRYAIIY